MRDAVLYVSSHAQFIEWLTAHSLEYQETGSVTQTLVAQGFNCTPAIVNADRSMIYLRFSDREFDTLRDIPGIEILAAAAYTGTGTADRVYQQINDDPEKLALYESVYDTSPKEIDDGEGGTVTITPPFKFGMLAESHQPVPESVTSRQGMEQLIRSGLDEQVDDAINSINDPVERKLARNWLDKAGVWERDNPQLLAIGGALGLTPQDVDSLFIQAATL